MVLLHFLRQLEREYDFAFIVDDAPLKQGTYCPGTSIPVLPAANISQVPPEQPLAIVIMPWNFLEEISFRIQNLVRFPRVAPVVLVVPFPRHKMLLLHPSGPPTEVLPPAQPNSLLQSHVRSSRVQLALVAEITDADGEYLRSFIQHHAPIFDLAIVVDHSTSAFVQSTFEAAAPSCWRLTRDPNAVASSLFHKSQFNHTIWAIKLRGHQFLVHPDVLAFVGDFAGFSLHFPVVKISERATGSYSSSCLSLLCNRTVALGAAVYSRIPIIRTAQLSFAASDLDAVVQGFDKTPGQDAAAASASEGFVADLKVSSAEEDAGVQSLFDLGSVGSGSEVLQQARAAWFQVHNQVLRLGCRGCRNLRG